MLTHAHAPSQRTLLCNINELILNLNNKYISQDHYNQRYFLFNCFVFVLFAIFILHSRESELYRYTLDGKSALAWVLPFSRFMGHLSFT